MFFSLCKESLQAGAQTHQQCNQKDKSEKNPWENPDLGFHEERMSQTQLNHVAANEAELLHFFGLYYKETCSIRLLVVRVFEVIWG